jgi:hypothetical protein
MISSFPPSTVPHIDWFVEYPVQGDNPETLDDNLLKLELVRPTKPPSGHHLATTTMSRWFGTLTPRKTLPSSDSASNITPSGKALTAGTTSTTTPFVAFEAVHAHLPAIAQSSSTAEGGESSKRAEREVVVEHWHFRPNVVGTPDDEEHEQVEGDAVDHDEADEHRSDEATDQHDREHATSASVDSTNNLLLRLVNRSSTLEIRPLSTYTTTPILRLSFPSRLIDLPPCTTYTHPVTGRMTVILVSATNRIHRLEIPPGGQYDEVEMYTNEIRRDVLVGTVVGWEVVSDVDLVVACGETLIRCSWDEHGEFSLALSQATLPRGESRRATR